MSKFSSSFFRITLLFFITCNAFTNECYGSDSTKGFFENITYYGKLFLGETSFYLDDKNFDTQDCVIFSNDTFFDIIECSKSKNANIKVGCLIFKDDKKFTIHISNNNTLSVYQENGIISESSQPVKFHLDKGSTLNLFGANVNENKVNTRPSSPVLYQIDHGSHLNFEGASPREHTEVNLSTDSMLTFSKSSQANALEVLITEPSSKIKLNQSSLILGASGADCVLNSTLIGDKSSQLIKEGFGVMSLNGDFSPFEGSIIVNNGEIDLQGNLSANQATVCLLPNTKLSVSQNNTLGTVYADEYSQINLDKYTLTIGSSKDDSLLVGEIVGNESSQLIKEGTGTLSLYGKNQSFEGDMIVNEGRVILCDSHLGGNTVVNQNGKLSGSGKIAKDLTNVDGVIDLGENDLLKIGGNFFQSENSEYILKVNKHGRNGKTQVDGIATFNNRPFKIRCEDFRLCCPYVFVEAEKIEGEIHENPTSMQSLNPNVELTATRERARDKENITLRFLPNLLRDSNTLSQQEVAKQLKKINNTEGEYDQPLNHLIELSEEDIPKALDHFSGKQYTHFILAAERSTGQFIRRIYTPLQTVSIDHDCEELRMNKWITWGDLEFGKTFQKGAHGYDMMEYSATATIQKSMNDWLTESCPLSEIIPCEWLIGWTAGLAGSYAYQCYDFNHGGDANLHNAKGAFYALLTKPVYYLLLDFILGCTSGKTERSIKCAQINEKAHSDLNLYQATIYGELGLNNIFCYNLRIQPFIGIEAGYYHLGDCTEHGGELFDLKIKEQNDCLATSYVGLHFFNFQNDDTRWGISADIIWKHLFEYENHLEGKFAHFGDNFKICGRQNDLNGFEGTLTYFQRINDCWVINAEISGERWARYSNFYLSIGCSYHW